MAEAAMRGALALGTRPDLGKLVLRADSETAAAAGRALGVAMPGAVNRASGNTTMRALRLGPDEFLLVMPRDAVAATLESLDQALGERHHALVDISARLVALEIDGPAVRDTLAAACPVDLHAAAFGPDQATRTVLGKAEIILDCRSTNHFQLLVNRSFAPYLQRLLTEAGREHGLGTATA